MESDQQVWRQWSARLKRWGIINLMASLLEAIGPLSVLAAQIVYLGQPLMQGIFPEKNFNVAARLFEDPDRLRMFTQLLREEKAP